jgi:flagellar hook assembly protein FlgD
VLRKLFILAALAALAAAVVSSAAVGRSSPGSVSTSVLAPGMTYTREVGFTSRGPIVFDVVTAPRPDGKLYLLAPALSNGALVGKETLTHLETRVGGGATTVAIDGDYFDSKSGVPNGIFLQNGVISSAPGTGRSSLGITAGGALTTAHVTFGGIWRGKGLSRPLSLNMLATKGGKFTLYTPSYGAVTPRETGVLETVIGTLPATKLDAPLDGTVTRIANAGPTAIPAHGAVLVARGAQSIAQLKAEAPVRQQVEVMLSLSPDWRTLTGAIGGGPLLVRNGKPIFHAGESFQAKQLNTRQPRGAIGQLAGGRIVLVGVEGSKPSYSIGMSSYELAVELSQLGAVTAFGLGSGPAAGIAFDGKLLTRPANGITPKVSDALVLSYSGVYAAPPSTLVLSPNGDRVGDTETLSYRVARPSKVVATLSGPAGVKATLVNGQQIAPGLHSITWNGTLGGSVAAEGKWTFSVTATDDRDVTTTAQRTFSLDDTLSSLAVATARNGRPTASFQLTRPATVLVQIQRRNGVPVATLRKGPQQAGPELVTWKGRIAGHRAPSGRYQLSVQATSSVGKSSLAAPFTYRSRKRH